MRKYGNEWDRVDGCPLTNASWLCATIDADQIWVDEVGGYKFLREGKFYSQWFECKI